MRAIGQTHGKAGPKIWEKEREIRTDAGYRPITLQVWRFEEKEKKQEKMGAVGQSHGKAGPKIQEKRYDPTIANGHAKGGGKGRREKGREGKA